MTRLYVVVEGQTEESFVGNVLSESLWQKNIDPRPIVVGRPGHKGGRTSYVRVKPDIVKLLKQDSAAYCSTMVDLYGLGPGFPGVPWPANLNNLAKVRHVEQAFKKDICDELPKLRADVRFIPYLQLHEYEGLLFSDPAAFAKGIRRRDLTAKFQSIRDDFGTPEDINSDPQTAPSKRVLAEYPSYSKVIDGTLAAKCVGIAAMREQCQHFREWLELLEAIVKVS